MYKIRQQFARDAIADIAKAASEAVDAVLSHANVKSGAKVAITAGSRGIQNIVLIMRTVAQQLRAYGYEPFFVAAMGSHGRGEAAGQRALLASLGISEESVGAPISCSHEVMLVGESESGLPVYVAKEAALADAILLLNRIKPHTSFHGPYESGLLKMASVGLGRARGANMVHSLGAERLAQAIPEMAKVVFEKTPIIGGIAILENAYEETKGIYGIPRANIWQEETRLLEVARSLMPRIPVDELDLCLVKEMGKNFSGTGMDTNIIGRLRIQGMSEPVAPRIKYIGVLDLSEASHGNATGVGLADFVTRRLVEKIDYEATYLNCLTSGFVIRAFVPVTLDNDEKLFYAALKALKMEDASTLRLAIIKNTLFLEEMWVSDAVYQEIKSQVQTVAGPFPLSFDERGLIVCDG
jgi:hypothetical protein